MKAVLCYNLFDRYLIDDYHNIYKKGGMVLNRKDVYTLKMPSKNGIKYCKVSPAYCRVWAEVM